MPDRLFHPCVAACKLVNPLIFPQHQPAIVRPSASGGRAYFPENTVDLCPIYDDMMENLKVRYVITYRSSNDLDPNTPRSVRVALLIPRRAILCASLTRTASRCPRAWSCRIAIFRPNPQSINRQFAAGEHPELINTHTTIRSIFVGLFCAQVVIGTTFKIGL